MEGNVTIKWNMTMEWNETIKWKMTVEWNETAYYGLQKWNMNVVLYYYLLQKINGKYRMSEIPYFHHVFSV